MHGFTGMAIYGIPITLLNIGIPFLTIWQLNQIAYLRGKRYETEKKIWGGDRHSEEFKSSSLPNANLKDKTKTSEVLGSEYGVHKSTIIRNANFAKVIDILPEEVKNDVLSGEEKISRTMTDAILDFDKPTQKKFIKEKNGITFLTILAAENSAVKYLLIFARL
jgi:hypothetical protein